MKNRNWFWGFFFVLSAIAVIAIQLGSFAEIGIWSLLAGVLLLALIIHSLFSLFYFGIFIPLALLYMVFWEPLGLVEVSPWILLLSGLFASIGFSILFHRRRKPKMIYNKSNGCCGESITGSENANSSEGGSGNWSESKNSETIDDNHPYAKVQFGASSKYLHSDNLESGRFIASFGELEVFFDQVRLSPNGTEISLDCSFASIILHIPKEWRVNDKLHVSLAEVTNNRRSVLPADDAPQITITGNVQFGGVEIQYI